MATEARYEMAWDCPRCDTPGLLGLTHRHCPNCGAPQDPTKRYFPKDEDKVAVGDHPYVGVDKACPHCETPNSAAATFCGNCGSALDEAKGVALRSAQEARSSRDFGADSARAARDDLDAQKKGLVAPAKAKAKGGGRWKILLAGALVLGVAVVVCAGIGLAVFWKREAALTVVGHEWARAVPIEQYQSVSDSAWRDQVPADARRVSCVQAERSTKKVEDGQDCRTERVDKGDGSFSEREKCTPKYRSEPVYDDKCSFVADRWRPSRTERAAGASLTDVPRWPDVALACTGTRIGCERESRREETYTVSFGGEDGQTYGCDVAQARWSTLPLGSKWKAPVGVLTDSVDCDALVAP